MPLFGPPNINKLKSQANIKDLKRALSYRKDEDIRRSAALALRALGWEPEKDQTGAWYWTGLREWEKCVEINQLAVEPLIALTETYPVKGAVEALGLIGNQRAVKPLIVVLQSETKRWRETRPVAARALGQIGDTRAIPPLIATLKDGYSSSLPDAAVKALAAIGAPAVQPLIDSLSDGNKYVRKRAADALGMIGDERAAEFLIPLLSEELYDRKAAMKALIAIGSPSIQPLHAVLSDSIPSVRLAAAKALGAIGGSQVVKALMTMFRDSDKNVIKVVDKSLAEIGPPAVVLLRDALKDEKNDVRWRAAEVLGQIADSQAVSALITTLRNDNDSEVRTTAARALVRIGSSDSTSALINHILGSPYTWVREAMQHMQASLGYNLQPNDVGALFWASQGEWNRCAELGSAAIHAFKSILSIRAEHLNDHTHSRNKDISTITFTSVLKEKRRREQSGYDTWPEIMKALVKTHDPGSVLLLVRGLSDDAWQVRDAAREGLASLDWKPKVVFEKVLWWLTGDYYIDQQLDNFNIAGIVSSLVKFLDWDLSPDDWTTKARIVKLLMRPGVNTTDAIRDRASTELENYARQCVEALDAVVKKPKIRVDTSKLKGIGSYYARLIATAASYYHARSHGDGSGGSFYRFDNAASLSAVKQLCEIVTPVSTNLLHHLTRLADTEVISRTFEVPYDFDHPSGTGSNTKMLSFMRQREVAAAELEKRGNPAYSPTVYITEDCWRLPEI